MIEFDTLFHAFEQTKNVCRFCEEYGADEVAKRFLLIRSLDKKSLKEIVAACTTEDTDGDYPVLYRKVYRSSVSVSDLLRHIEGKRQELIRERETELAGLSSVIADFPVVNCGVRNDKIDDIVKAFVRNNSIKSREALIRKLDVDILPRVRQYCLWSYYNQTSNDIIELFFLKHPAVIPTLRKIPNIDFFLKVGDRILPFDLKFTHISDSYFDLASQGIVRDSDPTHHDDFFIRPDSGSGERQKIKTFYTALKKARRELALPNISGLDKNALCNLLTATGDESAVRFVSEIKRAHRKYVPENSDALYPLEWWNYKYQGERLFCNNNRFFVFLAYNEQFVDGRELKGRTKEIGERITGLLDTISEDKLHTVRYHYDKEPGLIGDYSALSVSVIYSE